MFSDFFFFFSFFQSFSVSKGFSLLLFFFCFVLFMFVCLFFFKEKKSPNFMRQMIVVFVQQNLCRALQKILICRWLKRIKHSRFYVEGWGTENLMFIERKKIKLQKATGL